MRRHLDRTLILSFAVAVAIGACSDDTTVVPETGDGGTETGSTGDGDGDGDGDPGDGDGDGDGDPGDGDGDNPCPIGGEGCPCTQGGACDAGLTCDGGVCVPGGGDGDGDGDSGCVDDADCAFLDGPCTVGACNNNGVCVPVAINDSDPCGSGQTCMEPGQCQNGVCIEEPKDCSMLTTGCIIGYCDDMTDQCDVMLAADDTPCADAMGCSSAPVCTMGVCEDPTGEPLFYEDFADNSAGWVLDMTWEIGPAMAGCGDPGMDHSPTMDNGVAGVVLGGCAPTQIHPYYCLTSPAVDTTGPNEVWMTYYRDLWSDYTPYMKNVIEVWDGNMWQLIFETEGQPEVNDNGWMYFAYDVSAHANADMQFRWCYNINAGDVYQRGSWNVDDVTISASECNGAD